MTMKLCQLLIVVLLSLGVMAGCGSEEPVLEIDGDCLDRQESLGMGQLDRYMMCSNTVEVWEQCASSVSSTSCPEILERGAIVRQDGTIYECPPDAFSGSVMRYDQCSISGSY